MTKTKGDTLMIGRRTLTRAAGAVFILAAGAAPASAQFILQVDIDPPGAGIVAKFPAGDEFQEGEVVTLTATPAEGFAFVGWTGDINASESSMTLVISDDTVLTAVFEESEAPRYTLTAFVDPSGAGTIVRDPADFDYAEGEQVTLNAYAGQGFVFTGWSGDLPDDADELDPVLVLTMNADLDVRANYAAGQTLDDGPSGSGGAGCGALGMVGFATMLSLMFMLKLGGMRRD